MAYALPLFYSPNPLPSPDFSAAPRDLYQIQRSVPLFSSLEIKQQVANELSTVPSVNGRTTSSIHLPIPSMEDEESPSLKNNISEDERLLLDEDLDRLSLQDIALSLKRRIPLSEGKRIHAHAIERGLQREPYVGNLLICMYRKCGALTDARSVFDSMPNRNVVSWTAIITSYIERGLRDEAFQMFIQMQQQNVEPNPVTFIIILGACAEPEELSEGAAIHSRIVQCGLCIHIGVATALVTMYGKCGAIEEARTVFDKMHHRNVISWTAMIGAYAQHGHGKSALHLFEQMQREGLEPNSVTFITILGVCGSLATLSKGKMVHMSILEAGLESDMVVGTALVHMYGKCKAVEDSRSVFDRLDHRDVICWNAVIMAYAERGYGKEAFELFQQMQKDDTLANQSTFISVLCACNNGADILTGRMIHACIVDGGFQWDDAVGTALVLMYGKCEALEDAHLVFAKLCCHDVDSWNAIIFAYSQFGHINKAYELFQQMQQLDIRPNELTFTSILEAHNSPEALAGARAIHSLIVSEGLESDVVATALLSVYGNCGALGDVHSVFDHLKERDPVAWTALIEAYSQYGHGQEALCLFRAMQWEGVQPDEVTFGCILSACSHAGLVEEGLHVFVSMVEDYSVPPMLEHYCSLIDLLGRAGQLDEAEKTIFTMPFQPDAAVWLALLGACKLHGDVKRGERVADHILDLDSENAAVHILLSNMYAEEGRQEDLKGATEAVVRTRVNISCQDADGNPWKIMSMNFNMIDCTQEKR